MPYTVVAAAGLMLSSITSSQAAAPRVTRDLQALYTFEAGSGDTVRDRSGVRSRLDLKIEKPAAVKWQNGSLLVRSSTRIQSSGPAKKIIDAVKRSGSVTIEAWIKPESNSQEGPARIVSLSGGSSDRNFTLGQDEKRYDVRLRTTSTSRNGIPSTAAAINSARTLLTHVVFTRDSAGNAIIYINGQQQITKQVAGRLSNWGESFRLLLANEASGDRQWLGTFYLVAMYKRALSAGEVAQNFKAGAQAAATPIKLAGGESSPGARLFETKIAPLFAKRCLECHDSRSKKGGLDLSRKVAALAGGETGKAIVPGKASASLLWESVESGEMPEDGKELSAQEKLLIRKWIDDGATWTVDAIDPAIYAHEGRSGNVWIQRLTVPEYIETVRSVVGIDIEKDARRILPPELRADGFSNTAYNLNVDLKHVEAYSRLAEIIVSRMDVLKFAAKFSKSRKLSTDDTMRDFVAAMGKWLLRGPLDDREVSNYSGIATTVASAGGDYKEAVGLLIEAMLQSPRFIYRIENQRGDGTAWPVGEYELASRMSYILWGAPPDKELMRAVDKGELIDRSRVESQVARMLRDPRAIERSAQFIAEWLDLDRLSNMKPNRKRFPKWNDSLAADMRAETLAFFKDVAWKQKRPLADLFNAQVTYATPRLAKHYGLKPKGEGLSRYNLSAVPARGGLLTQGSVLTIGGDDGSMVTRGLFVLHGVLRGIVKDPPPGLDTTPMPAKPGLSQRQIAEKRIANVSCSACHTKFEPLAFGLERFDGLGSYREKDEHGNTLREDGEILVPGTAKSVKYKTSAELMNLLAGSERVRETMTWKVTQFALGRPLAASDARIVDKIHKTSQKGGGTYSSLITAIVMSDLVQMTRTEAEPSETKR